MMRILVACEESQIVTTEFRLLGHEAFSCDILPTSGNHPEWHIQDDARSVINDGWDMILAFPPCTYLTISGNRWFDEATYGAKARQRKVKRTEALWFFMLFARANCPRIAIENPVGVISRIWRKPDCMIHPYQFGDPVKKRTCLWLKGLPCLRPTDIVEPEMGYLPSGKRMATWFIESWNLPKDQRARYRSKTFPGIARAMAEQWGHDDL